jgi:energy-converting hydrogenase Eha subunit G
MMVLCGWIFGWEGYTLTPVQWLMALVEVFGIWVIAMNPLDVFRKKEA